MRSALARRSGSVTRGATSASRNTSTSAPPHRRPRSSAGRRAAAAIAAGILSAVLSTLPTQAVVISGVQNGALDQPKINVAIFNAATYDPANPVPQSDPNSLFIDENGDIGIGASYNVEAYLDTGASGVLFSNSVATNFNLPAAFPMQGGAVYSDVGVNGNDNFGISASLRLHLAPYVYGHPGVDKFTDATRTVADTSFYQPIPTLANSTLRAQVGPIRPVVEDPIDDLINSLLGEFDVVGMPTMKGRMVVLDPKPVNNFDQLLNADITTLTSIPDVFMRSWVYNSKSVPFNAATQDTDPGVPTTTHHVKLTYASFDRFTTTTGGTAPDLSPNPIIGLDPNTYPDMNAAKGGIRIGRTTSLIDAGLPVKKFSEGNWLLDTGAAASIISTVQAKKLRVDYLRDSLGGIVRDVDGNPKLVDMDSGLDIPGQFVLSLNGVGATSTKLAGFFLDDLLLRTTEGGSDDNDPGHILFDGAPVLVGDITLRDPAKADGDPAQFLTLDGIFGMNFLVASGLIDELTGATLPDVLSTGAFDWITIDFTDAGQGILGLSLADAAAVPEPASLALLAAGSGLLLRRRK